MLATVNLLLFLAVILVGTMAVLPRLLIALASAAITMSVLFLARLNWVAKGGGRGFALFIVGALVFLFVSWTPWLPWRTLRPMSLVDLVQQPFSFNTVLVVLLGVSLLCALMGHLLFSSRR